MNKKILIIVMAAFLTVSAFCQDRIRTRGKESGMMLDLSKFSMGTMNKVEDKKQYLSTIQLEKQRIQNYTLGIVYENAFLFYRRGDFQRAQELAESILAVDPEFKNARTLADQAHRMGTYGTVSEAEIISAKKTDGQTLYSSGRLIEAQRKYQEVLAIRPTDQEARNQIAKIDKEIATEYDRRGDSAYSQQDYNKALDQWYNALLIRKDDGALVSKITKAEKQVKDADLQAAMKDGVENYTNGKLLASYDSFQKALKIQPGEPKAAKFSAQLRTEIGQGYVSSGNKAYSAGRYDNAVANWQEAKNWGYDSGTLDAAIKKARAAKNAPPPSTTKTTSSSSSAAGSGSEGYGAGFTPPTEQATFQTTLPTVDSGRVSEENKRLSQEAYQRGIKAFNDEDYETARKEWTSAKQLDPGNTEAEQGLRRVQEILEWR
ncbi:MAG: hypothetical protein LBI01_05055 [Elusimicrobium sp.]|jgi:tetratricopeptide (TPR) repeat protein|nr:hypothetical protein [Elusimicrobium sp.]